MAAWGRGDREALEKLTPLVYDELHRLASHYLRGQHPSHTLQATALVHEAYIHLLGLGQVSWKDRGHFIALAARIMRCVLTSLNSIARLGQSGQITCVLDNSQHQKSANKLVDARPQSWQTPTTTGEQARRARSRPDQYAWAKRRVCIKMIRRFSYSALTVLAIASLASADTFSFSFSGGGITSSGTLTAVSAPDSTSGVSTPGTYEVTGITGTFTDSNDGISGAITGLYTPLSYITPLTETATIPVGFTTGGLSYDDLFFPTGNSAADCPGYPFSGGDFDILGVAFNVTGGYVGEFFSDGDFPGFSGPVYAAADANSSTVLDNPNPDGIDPYIPVGVVGTFTATPEPGSLLLLASGLGLLALRFAGRAHRS